MNKEEHMETAEEVIETEAKAETRAEKKAEKKEKKAAEKANLALEEANKKLSELTDSHLRLKADFDNYKKRNQMAAAEAYHDGMAAALTEFLKVMDNMERALAAAKEAGSESIANGIQLSMDSFMKSFEKQELARIESDGAEFDPNFHNAVMQQPTDDEALRGKIAQTFQVGYTMGKKVLRHSMVAVYA
ncbi:MAG: nucleotide exchange factor GrpE [Clostridiales bacterium]|nr:nucleotide exchange factor GrpE [Clostridiales bacterium]